MILNPQKLNT